MIRRIKLYFIRKTKAVFLRLNFHVLVGPFTGIMTNLSNLSRFSKWRKIHSNPPYNDFYSKKFDFGKRYNLYKFLLNYENISSESINYLEFGVCEGASFRWWIENNKSAGSKFVGFDTFEGLPENWNVYKKGDMSTSGSIPVINDSRHEFVVGLFQNTLPGFLRNNPLDSSKRNVINMDADLYSSTLYVLGNLYPFLKKGDIIIFDEFGVPNHEFRAFTDFFSSFYIKYELLAASNNYYQIAIKII